MFSLIRIKAETFCRIEGVNEYRATCALTMYKHVDTAAPK